MENNTFSDFPFFFFDAEESSDLSFEFSQKTHPPGVVFAAAVIWELIKLKASAFMRRGRHPEENISRAGTVVCPRFLY